MSMITYSHLSIKEVIILLNTNSWQLQSAIKKENAFWNRHFNRQVIIPHTDGYLVDDRII